MSSYNGPFERRRLSRWFTTLAAHHAPELAPGQAFVLVLQALGMDNDLAARAMGNRPATVANQARRARERALPPSVGPTRPAASAWAFLHRRCCLASAWARAADVVEDDGKQLLQ